MVVTKGCKNNCKPTGVLCGRGKSVVGGQVVGGDALQKMRVDWPAVGEDEMEQNAGERCDAQCDANHGI